MAIDPLQAWADSLVPYSAAPPSVIPDSQTVEVDMTGFPGVKVNEVPPPPGATLIARNVAAGAVAFVLGQGPAPDLVRIFPTGDLRRIKLQNESGIFKRVEIDSCDLLEVEAERRIEIENLGDAPEQLHLARGHFSLRQLGASPSLTLDAAAFRIGSGPNEFSELRLIGQVQLETSITSRQTFSSDAVVALHDGVNLGQLKGLEGWPRLHLESRHTAVFSGLDDGAEIIFSGGEVQLRGRCRRAAFQGSGIVGIYGEATDCAFFPHKGTLHLQVYGQLTGAKGTAELSAMKDSVVIGALDQPLSLTRLHVAEGAQLENLGLYQLQQLSDLVAIAEAERFEPWIPRPAWSWKRPWLSFSRKAARNQEDEMGLGGGSDETMRRKRSHFWARLSAILRDGHAVGGVQSEVRYAAFRSRRAALPPGREKAVLFLYWLVGYGERIVQPLLWLAFLAALAAPVMMDPKPSSICCNRTGDFLGSFASLFLSPLAFFRFAAVPEADGFWEVGSLLIVRVVGVLMMFFALNAARRLAKPD